jgi:hypothetical protein
VISADLTLIDEQGCELVSISDFLLRRIDPQAIVAALAPDARATSTSASAVADAGAGGIAPAEGAEALLRLLAASELGSQVVVSAVPINR